MRLYYALAAAQVSLIQLRSPAAVRSDAPDFHSVSEGESDIASVAESDEVTEELGEMTEDAYVRLAALGPREKFETSVVRTSLRLDSHSDMESDTTSGACPAPNNEPLLNDISLSEGPHVTKTIFDGPRWIFLAGLEGTGHHLYMGSFDFVSTGFDQDVIALFDTRKTSVCGPAGSLGEDCGPAEDSEDFMTKRDSLVEKLKALHSQGRRKSYGHRGAYSYPFFRDAGRAILTHPDVRVLAEVAELAQIDLRVVVLTRNARAMLYSTVKHRRFCPSIERQGNYLIHNANVLSAQLSRIDKRFVLCAPFEQLPHISGELAELYDTALGKPSGYSQRVVNETYDEAANTHEMSFTAEEEQIASSVQQSADKISTAAQC